MKIPLTISKGDLLSIFVFLSGQSMLCNCLKTSTKPGFRLVLIHSFLIGGSGGGQASNGEQMHRQLQ